jgi:hypothetical protein
MSELSMQELESELVGLAGHLAAAHCRWLTLLAEFDDRDGWGGPGMRSCAHWLSWRVGMSLRTGFEQVRVAHALVKLSAVSAAFAAGRISYSKVRAITRVATPATEQQLLNLALAGTASHVEKVVRAARQAQADPELAQSRRHLGWSWDDDGTLRLHGRLSAEQGALLLAALASITDRPQPAQCSAEHSDTPLPARRADALLELVAGDGAPAAELVVHLDADEGTARIDHGPAIPRRTAERIGCGARVRALLRDARGNPLYLGRTRRLVSKTLRAAIHARDHCECRFPGCHETRHLDAHHIQPWWLGGRTDIDNVILLCDRHHRLIHDHGYRMRGRGTDVTFLRPTGEPIPATGPAIRGDAGALANPDLAEDALTPSWSGERLDLDAALASLLPAATRAA